MSLEITLEHFWFIGFGLDVIAETTSVIAVVGAVVAWKFWKKIK